MIDTEKYIGLLTEDAIKLIKSDGLNYRIVSDDNCNYVGTCDFDLERLNLTINKGIVVNCYLG